MPQNNFKVTTGGFHLSKSGHDSAPGTMDNPRKSLGAIPFNTTTVLGSGVYSGSLPNVSGTFYNITADGLVICKSGTWGSLAIIGSLVDLILESITIRSTGSSIIRCKLKSCSVAVAAGNQSTPVSSVFIDSTVSWVTASSNSIPCSSCIVVGSSVFRTGVGAQSAYIGPGSVLYYEANPTSFRNNNIQGTVRLNLPGSTVKEYAIKDQLIGTPQDNGYAIGVDWLTEAQLTADGYAGTIAGWNTAVATCMNRNPKFNNVTAEDFTLQSDSPHIKSGVSGGNIGGTSIAITVINSDDGNAAGTRVMPSAEIDTTIPTAYLLNAGQTQGYVDYVFKIDSKKILKLNVLSLFDFDSDIAGGSVGNNNVPDAQPLSTEYPSLTLTTGAPGVLNQIIVAQNLIFLNDWIRVNGQARQVTAVSNSGGNDTLTLSSNLVANIGSGVQVTYGTEAQIAALNPNRLTILMRTRSADAAPSVPLVNSDWDNEVDPSYGVVGTFFHQEVLKKPGLIISGLNIWGTGDSNAPTGIIPQDLVPEWVNIRVYLRNNYSSKGL